MPAAMRMKLNTEEDRTLLELSCANGVPHRTKQRAIIIRLNAYGWNTQAQITKTYGEEDTQILLQGTATKLILNCRDSQTANTFADLIGKVDLIDTQTSRGTEPLDVLPRIATKTESITREVYTVSPSQLQSLPPLEGYLLIGDGTPCTPIRLTPRSYPNTAKRLVRRAN